AVADLQRATERGLQALLALDLASMRGATLVLITTGLPYREEPGALLSRIADRIRDAGASLLLVRLNSSIVYTGFLHDAVDRLPSRVQRARVVRVGNDEQFGAVVAELEATEPALRQRTAPRANDEARDPANAPATPAPPPPPPAIDTPRAPGRGDTVL